MNNGLKRFFIIGAPKCGTTTLYDWLADHPRVFAPHKETCFFSQDVMPTDHLSTHIPSFEAYEKIFEPDNAEVMVTGEATPKYLYSEQARREIPQRWPEAKIIVCLRDPVDLVVSLYNQKLREGEETASSFEIAWRRSKYSEIGSTEIGPPEISGEVNYVFWAHVGHFLKLWSQVVEPHRIFVTRLEGLKSDPKGVYNDVLQFLELEDDQRDTFLASNERQKIRSLMAHNAMKQVKRNTAFLRAPIEKLRGGKGTGIHKLFNRVNNISGKYTSDASVQLKVEIIQRLQSDIENTDLALASK